MNCTTTITERRVWVGCLACYNAGDLNGVWLEPAEAVDWVCTVVDVCGPHEETWCFDIEGFAPGSGEMSPCEALRISEQMDADEECGIPGVVAAEWRAEYGADADISEAYRGCFDSLKDMIEQDLDEGLYGDEVSALWESHPGWVDVDAIVNDVRCGGDYTVIVSGVADCHIFNNF